MTLNKVIGRPKKEEINKRYTRLLVVSESNRRIKGGYISWNCICDCGNRTTVLGYNLRNGNTKSCGCLRGNGGGWKDSRASFNKLFGNYKRMAKKRGLNFTLSKKQFRKLTTNNCYYCGGKPKQVLKNVRPLIHGNFIYNGIDRVNNDLGYTLKNCVPCCGRCNRWKSSITKNEFLAGIDEIHEYQQNK